MLVGELFGRLLWLSPDEGLAFVGAMIAMGCTVGGIYLAVRRWFGA